MATQRRTKTLLLGLLLSLCTTHVQAEPKMFRDDKGRWLNSEGGNIYGDSRFNIDADPRFNINADPRFNIEANPNFSIDGDTRYQ